VDILEKLAAELGSGHVLTSEADRAPYDRDWTGNYIGKSLAVVRPANTHEVAEVMKLASQSATPVVPMGGNTGLSGGCYPGGDGRALILSLERMTRIRDINTATRTATVEAGVVLEALHNAVDGQGLIFPLTFGAKGSCRIGGVLSTNAGGSNVLRYGNARALCLGLEVVNADGRVMNLMSSLRKDNSGYDLKDLFIGSEGTLGVITGAVLKLFPKPTDYGTAMVAVSGTEAALELLNVLNDRTGGAVEAFEYMPKSYFGAMTTRFPQLKVPLTQLADVNILMEVGFTGQERSSASEILESVLGKAMEDNTVFDAAIAQNAAQRQAMWACREAALEVILSRPPVVTTDIAVPLDKVGAFLERMNRRLTDIAPGAEPILFAHLGDGNIHYTVWMDPQGIGANAGRDEDLIAAVEALALEMGGTFSAEHGIGVYKLGSMRRGKNPVALDAMRQIKRALDPENILNPGKMLPD
jgi:FAD/FMN-containing dehydrogenase